MAARKVFIAAYRCGCTVVNYRRRLLEYCPKHGEDRRELYAFGFDDDPEVAEQISERAV